MCFDAAVRTELGRATGTFFDAHPREYLRTIAEFERSEQGVDALLVFQVLLTTVPANMDGDYRAVAGLFERRIALLDANADLLYPEMHEAWVRFFWQVLEERQQVFAKALANPATFTDPLLGIALKWPIQNIVDPAPSDFLTLPDMARTWGTFILGSQWSNESPPRRYLLISGHSLNWPAGEPRPTGLVSDRGWIERVDERAPREKIQVLGAPLEVLASGRIPPEAAAGICEREVKWVAATLEHEGRSLQSELDARISREPDAKLPQPLLDALRKAKYKVKKYGVMESPAAAR